MKRLDYETLAMREIIVEMENGFLSASADVQNPNTDQGQISPHQVNDSFTSYGDFSDEGWD